MNKKIILAILALSFTTIFCTFQPGGQESPMPDVYTKVDGTLTAMALITNIPIPTVPVVSTISTLPATGGISGHLSYPSDFIPPLRVVAFDATNVLTYFYVDTVLNQFEYSIFGLPAGIYHIVSYKIGSKPLAGGYTRMVPCGLATGCEDHSFIDVVVIGGVISTNIDPGDWYAAAGAFPPMPNP